MEKLEIKKEALPQRCEICHKTDYFDPQNNYCLRCKDIFARNFQPTENSNIGTENKEVNRILESFIRAIIGVFLLPFSIFLWIGLFSEYGAWYIQNSLLGILTFFSFVGFPVCLMIFLPKLLSKYKKQ